MHFPGFLCGFSRFARKSEGKELVVDTPVPLMYSLLVESYCIVALNMQQRVVSLTRDAGV